MEDAGMGDSGRITAFKKLLHNTGESRSPHACPGLDTSSENA